MTLNNRQSTFRMLKYSPCRKLVCVVYDPSMYIVPCDRRYQTYQTHRFTTKLSSNQFLFKEVIFVLQLTTGHEQRISNLNLICKKNKYFKCIIDLLKIKVMYTLLQTSISKMFLHSNETVTHSLSLWLLVSWSNM